MRLNIVMYEFGAATGLNWVYIIGLPIVLKCSCCGSTLNRTDRTVNDKKVVCKMLSYKKLIEYNS